MARVRKAKHPKVANAEPEAEAGSDAHGRRMPTSKSDAVRMAIAAGFDTPQIGAGYIRSQFGLDITPEHFSAVKSADKKKVLAESPASKTRRKPKVGVEDEPARTARPAKKAGTDLIAAIETMTPLVAALGADKVKRIADLLS